MVREHRRGKETTDMELQGSTDYGLATSAAWFNQGGTKFAQGLALIRGGNDMRRAMGGEKVR